MDSSGVYAYSYYILFDLESGSDDMIKTYLVSHTENSNNTTGTSKQIHVFRTENTAASWEGSHTAAGMFQGNEGTNIKLIVDARDSGDICHIDHYKESQLSIWRVG